MRTVNIFGAAAAARQHQGDAQRAHLAETLRKTLLPISAPPPARGAPLTGSFFSCGPIPGMPISIMGSLHHNVCSASCEGNVEHCFLCKRINTVSGP